ncbi:hypothetical protein [Solwaraspora sp. WMMA2101]|uniref:hypothetical protein n=1 Tax=Solwaraspora sp. WMMA2101 TaxID=3404124 RepID=UPI003B93D775
MSAPPASHDRRPLIMIVGMGDLSTRVAKLLAANPATNRLVLAGRDVEGNQRLGNLVRFAAANLGSYPDIASVSMDLDDIAATAETLARVRPDVVFMGASLQAWHVITRLPKDIFEALDEAQFGPWLPMHLTLNYQLMQAVRMSGSHARVVNAAFPDAVGPVLRQVGLAPTIGIGNVANIIPALTFSAAAELGEPPEDVRVQLVTQHYFSHYVPRFGTAGDGAYALAVSVRGVDRTDQVRHESLFARLTGDLKRQGGIAGQHLTAASAVRVLTAMATGSGAFAHAPAPDGLPGGYPVRVDRDGGTIDLPAGLTLAEAVEINERCQRSDGIEAIHADGSVTFTEPEMAIMRKYLGYECRTLSLPETAVAAAELRDRFAAFAATFR